MPTGIPKRKPEFIVLTEVYSSRSAVAKMFGLSNPVTPKLVQRTWLIYLLLYPILEGLWWRKLIT
jgi:hypothetical protein